MSDTAIHNEIFTANFAALEHEYPDLARRVTEFLADNGLPANTVNAGRSIAPSDIPQGNNCIILLGLDPAEYLLSIAAYVPRYAFIIVIEKSLPDFIAILFQKDISSLISGWQVKFIIDVAEDDFNRTFNQYYFQIDSVAVIKAPQAYPRNAEYYTRTLQAISVLIGTRKPSGVKSKTYTFIMLVGSSGTGWPYILQDCIAALHQLGHHAYTYNIGNGYDAPEFLHLIDAVKPDGVFLLDAIGLVPEILEKTGVPYISWFFDNPFLWLKDTHVSDNYHIVVWDKTYVDDLCAMGFKHVAYVPLGANPAVYYPRNIEPVPMSFVGSSLFHEAELPFDEEAKKVFIQQIARDLCRSPWTPIEHIIANLSKQMGISFAFDDPSRKHEFEAFVQNYARSGYRKEIIQQFLAFDPYIYGDKGWMNIVSPGKGTYKGRINNRIALPELYAASQININITVPQLRDSFSHRAFEIPACKGFLLSDYRPAAEEFFELGKEIVCFRSFDELLDKAAYYLCHPEECSQIAERGYQRVIAEHTYQHRLKKIVEFVFQ